MSAFLGRLSAQRGDAIGLITFSSEPIVLVEIGQVQHTLRLIEERLYHLEAGGNTALMDAVALALRGLTRFTRHIRAIVVLSDGRENASRSATESLLVESLSESSEGPILFGLGYGRDTDYVFLNRLATRSGGAAIEGSIENISEVVDRLADLL